MEKEEISIDELKNQRKGENNIKEQLVTNSEMKKFKLGI